MHGNGVHNAGFNKPAVVAAVRRQLGRGALTFCPRRYTNIPAIHSPKSWRRSSDGAVPAAFSARRFGGNRDALTLAGQVTAVSRRFPSGLLSWSGFGAAASAARSTSTAGSAPCCPHLSRGFPQLLPESVGLHPRGGRGRPSACGRSSTCSNASEMSAVIGEPISAEPRHPIQALLGGAVRALCDRFGLCSFLMSIIEGFGRTGRCSPATLVTPDVSCSANL